MIALESLANATIGFAVSWAAILLRAGLQPRRNFGVTSPCSSAFRLTRSDVLRRIFARLA